MSKFTKSNVKSITVLDNDTVRKVVKLWDTDVNIWREHYKKISDLEPGLVKVKSISESVIMMENLTDTYPLHFPEFLENMPRHSMKVNQNFITNYFNLISNLLVFAQKYKFIHHDVNFGNLMIDNNGNIKLVDPNSFVFIDRTNIYEIQYKLLSNYAYLIDRLILVDEGLWKGKN